jgi:hypothetical protein
LKKGQGHEIRMVIKLQMSRPIERTGAPEIRMTIKLQSVSCLKEKGHKFRMAISVE